MPIEVTNVHTLLTHQCHCQKPILLMYLHIWEMAPVPCFSLWLCSFFFFNFIYLFILSIYLSIYLFIGCVGSSFLCEGFL